MMKAKHPASRAALANSMMRLTVLSNANYVQNQPTMVPRAETAAALTAQSVGLLFKAARNVKPALPVHLAKAVSYARLDTREMEPTMMLHNVGCADWVKQHLFQEQLRVKNVI